MLDPKSRERAMRKWNCLRRLASPLAWSTRRVARFRDAEGGATAIEFAFVAVPFLGLLAAIFETGLVYFATQGLEAAVTQAARTVLTGQVQGNVQITDATTFKNDMICGGSIPRVLPSFVNCSNVQVDVRTAGSSGSTSFSSAGTSQLPSPFGKYCTGAPGDIVIVRALYNMPVYFSILGATSSGGVEINRAGQTNVSGTGWVHQIVGVSAFKNEPFPGYTPPSTPC